MSTLVDDGADDDDDDDDNDDDDDDADDDDELKTELPELKIKNIIKSNS